ncbi:hypothetical protein [Serratia sp. BIGb0163]|uniref:hypothetical protein n=1 Tax=Serratia sp. BIGb0163 TaxID=2940613 RepID=UPI002169A8C7|nr:hypothetical protein [Serratia sp. BIGb0163]MCS4267305.1 hypothetical protein [Serratia sp. BIGb0163]
MVHMSREIAEHIVCQRGWLSKMQDVFRKRLLQHAQLLKFNAANSYFNLAIPPGDLRDGRWHSDCEYSRA